MKASQMELFTLKGLLESFAQSTGLVVKILSVNSEHYSRVQTRQFNLLESLVASLNLFLSPILACPWAPPNIEWNILGSS
jgi:hypothetical protein